MSLTVEELFKELSFGVLVNLAWAGEGSGEIEESHQAKLIHHTNTALDRLHGRFVLSQKELLIQLMEGITSYHLLAKYAQSNFDPNTTQPYYIQDMLNPFKEDVIKPLNVFDSTGRELPLNDEDNPLSVFTPNPMLLQIPNIIRGESISVTYQAKHTKLQPGVLSQVIHLPDVLHEALQVFIGHKIFSGMSGQENTAKGNEHLVTFNALCNEVRENDLVNSSMSNSGHKFTQRGFV